MGKTIGRFSYEIMGGPDHKPMPAAPIVTIHLQKWTQADDGPLTVSPQLMTEAEVDDYIKDLKDDLDNVGRLAKAALRKLGVA